MPRTIGERIYSTHRAIHRDFANAFQGLLALTIKTFVLLVTFAASTDLIGEARTERIASFDDYQACVLAGRTLYPHQHWECVPENQHPKDAPASR
jgi:hypothetical protein